MSNIQGIVAAVALSALASAAQAKAVLEEVMVTAQHRSQSLQDVPVSVSAMSGDKMIEAGINRMEDLQAYVPNLTVTESGISTDIFIRGIGTGMNQGFEQSVGMYVDGIYYGRAQLARAPFLDLQRAEVLRGPQNILHGKNSIAGAVNLHTANPGESFEAFVSALYEPNFDEQVFDLVLSGPVTDTLGVRFSTRLRDYGGYVENLTLDRYGPQHDQATYRLKFLWAVNDETTAELKLEKGSFDSVGRHGEVIIDLPSTSETFLFTGRTEAEILDRTFFPPLVDVDTHDSVRNNYQDFKGSSNGNYSNNDTNNITLKLGWSSPEGHEYQSITGLMAYKYDDLCDCDSTAAPLFKLTLAEDYWQFSQELRWLSPVGETVEYIGGVYLQRTDLTFNDKLIQDSPVVVGLLNAADFQDGGTRGDYDPNPLGGSAEETAGIGDAGNAVANITAPREFSSVSDIVSAFVQATFNVRDDLRLTLGGRNTYEKKTGSRSLDFADLNGNSLPIGEVDTVSAISFAAERHDLKGSRSEQHFSPLLNAQWEYSPEAMAYFTATRGFKAGGFDARSNQSPSAALTPANPGAVGPNRTSLVGTFEYDEEMATSFELGSKSTWLGGAAEFNVALFYTIYEDLQISIFDGTLGFNVGNAKEAITKGIEVDFRYQATEYLSFGGALALLDFEFTDFENGQCRQGQAPTSADGQYCDYTGQSNQYVADWSGTFVIGYLRPISPTMGLGLSLDVVFSDDYNPSSNVDPRVEQPGFTKFNGRIGIGAIDQRWEVSLVGKNLTDEALIVYAADTPLSHTIFGATTFTGFVEAPRSVALQMSYRW